MKMTKDYYAIGNRCVCEARLAQSVERWTFNPTVKGSSPLSGEKFCRSLLRHET